MKKTSTTRCQSSRTKRLTGRLDGRRVQHHANRGTESTGREVVPELGTDETGVTVRTGDATVILLAIVPDAKKHLMQCRLHDITERTQITAQPLQHTHSQTSTLYNSPPDNPDLGTPNLGLGLVDVGDPLTEVELRLLLGVATLDLDEGDVRVGVTLTTLVRKVTTLDVDCDSYDVTEDQDVGGASQIIHTAVTGLSDHFDEFVGGTRTLFAPRCASPNCSRAAQGGLAAVTAPQAYSGYRKQK
ncbi:hypothetical protein G7K_1797-t1 [Saitoella complicata NRRL Y-17804]|uniref:Uncharacterized protein n=1 Tax=Saitoella complicata (strain BCRC 22490 / CBS 7301 / JCM 7358 / NBRC 10748 / NRRL Y-17804) TaxID=698492 RepID=A0A0E9NDV9_SAICN|nr:hypothetical protein G7K_1797-t1 [Saitoella complicata NRRL Y-17804]